MELDWRVTTALILSVVAIVFWVGIWLWSYRLFATLPLNATLRVTIPTLALLAANLSVPTFTISAAAESGELNARGIGSVSNIVGRDTLIIVIAGHVLPAMIALMRVPPRTDY